MKLPQIFAHRGGREWAPENTLASFDRAVKLGVEGVELDIHRCATGELVVIHDEYIQRTTNGVGLVKDITYAELKRMSAGAWFAPEFREERIPSLAEVLELVDGKLIINIEIKSAPIEYPGIEDDLIELLDGYQYKDKLIVSSFDHKTLKSFHAKAPQYKTGLLAGALFVDLAEYAAKVGCSYFHPDFECLRQDAMDDAHAAGLKVNPWTVNQPRDWANLIRMGVDGIVTDDPEGLKQYLARLQTTATQ